MAELLDFLFGSGRELYMQRQDGQPPIPLPWRSALLAGAFLPDGTLLGYIAWKSQRRGFLWKLLPRALRPLDVLILGASGNEMMKVSRGLGTEVGILASSGLRLGGLVRQPWGSRIAIEDENHDRFVVCGKRQGSLFPFRGAEGKVIAGIALGWKGLAHNKFSSEKGFSVYFGDESWTPAQRCALLATSALIFHDFG